MTNPCFFYLLLKKNRTKTHKQKYIFSSAPSAYKTALILFGKSHTSTGRLSVLALWGTPETWLSGDISPSIHTSCIMYSYSVCKCATIVLCKTWFKALLIFWATEPILLCIISTRTFYVHMRGRRRRRET